MGFLLWTMSQSIYLTLKASIFHTSSLSSLIFFFPSRFPIISCNSSLPYIRTHRSSSILNLRNLIFSSWLMMALLIHEESSLISSTHQWNYDVFLSFKSEDTCYGFMSHLYQVLCDKGFNTFINDSLPKG